MKKILLSLLLVGCSQVESNDIVTRTGVAHYDRMEATPVVFKGELLDVVSDRMGAGLGVEIKRGSELIARHDLGLGLPSAAVFGSRMYIVGSTPWWTGTPNEVQLYYTDDLATMHGPVTLLRATGSTRYFNTSLAVDGDKYILALETCEAGTACFNTRFYQSSDLATFTEVGSMFSPNAYAACPTIRKLGDTYYMFYLHHMGGPSYETRIVRSKDLRTWEYGRAVVSPGLADQNNASDFDLVEFAGKVHIRHAVGSQVSRPDAFVNVVSAEYSGTLQQFVLEYF